MGGLVDCDAIYQAVVLGFATWSSNHRMINFHDLSKECKGSNPAVVPGGDNPPEEYDNECPSLEISVTAGPPLREAPPPACPRTRTPRRALARRPPLAPAEPQEPGGRRVQHAEGAEAADDDRVGGGRVHDVGHVHRRRAEDRGVAAALQHRPVLVPRQLVLLRLPQVLQDGHRHRALVVALFAITFGVASLALLLYMVFDDPMLRARAPSCGTRSKPRRTRALRRPPLPHDAAALLHLHLPAVHGLLRLRGRRRPRDWAHPRLPPPGRPPRAQLERDGADVGEICEDSWARPSSPASTSPARSRPIRS